MLQSRKDFVVVDKRDYIAEHKESGYRSYHLVVLYPLQTVSGEKQLLVEIQIRTLAMNFWATIEHSLNYKYSGNIRRRSSCAFKEHLRQLLVSMKKCPKLEGKFKKHKWHFPGKEKRQLSQFDQI